MSTRLPAVTERERAAEPQEIRTVVFLGEQKPSHAQLAVPGVENWVANKVS